MSGGLFTIEFFEDDDGRRPVEDWMESALTDLEFAALVAAFEHVLRQVVAGTGAPRSPTF